MRQSIKFLTFMIASLAATDLAAAFVHFTFEGLTSKPISLPQYFHVDKIKVGQIITGKFAVDMANAGVLSYSLAVDGKPLTANLLPGGRVLHGNDITDGRGIARDTIQIVAGLQAYAPASDLRSPIWGGFGINLKLLGPKTWFAEADNPIEALAANPHLEDSSAQLQFFQGDFVVHDDIDEILRFQLLRLQAVPEPIGSLPLIGGIGAYAIRRLRRSCA
jgi:hypothetical protein